MNKTKKVRFFIFFILITTQVVSYSKQRLPNDPCILEPSKTEQSIICEYSLNCGKQSPEKIFDFLKNIDLYYLDLSPGHKKFQLINSPILAIGTTIEVEETAGNQYVKHNYQVVKIIENMGKSS